MTNTPVGVGKEQAGEQKNKEHRLRSREQAGLTRSRRIRSRRIRSTIMEQGAGRIDRGQGANSKQ